MKHLHSVHFSYSFFMFSLLVLSMFLSECKNILATQLQTQFLLRSYTRVMAECHAYYDPSSTVQIQMT